MPLETTTFVEIFRNWTWKPIHNCPGRYTFGEGISTHTISDIVGRSLPIFEFAPEIAPDKVLVARFDDGGGMISYRKSGGLFLHTLNDESGFTRKLAQLGIKF